MSRTQEEFIKDILQTVEANYQNASDVEVEGYIAKETAKYVMEENNTTLAPEILEIFATGSEIGIKQLLAESAKVISSGEGKYEKYVNAGLKVWEEKTHFIE